jgi:hypothetical protein
MLRIFIAFKDLCVCVCVCVCVRACTCMCAGGRTLLGIDDKIGIRSFTRLLIKPCVSHWDKEFAL